MDCVHRESTEATVPDSYGTFNTLGGPYDRSGSFQMTQEATRQLVPDLAFGKLEKAVS